MLGFLPAAAVVELDRCGVVDFVRAGVGSLPGCCCAVLGDAVHVAAVASPCEP